MEAVDSKLAKDRKRQEQKLHQKLTALKQKKVEEKVMMCFELRFPKRANKCLFSWFSKETENALPKLIKPEGIKCKCGF